MREVDKIYQKDTGTSLRDDEPSKTETVSSGKQSKPRDESKSGSEVDIECHICNTNLRISSAEQTETVLAHFIVHYAKEYGAERFSCCHCNQTSARREGVCVCYCVAGSDVRLPPRGTSWMSCKG
ncbi:hypothetical protein WR25_21118 [Diploscapter pachys]|uniref:Uncharacterized protein n=1 Tax=Diploscapter pachys TaxID=2018661 RepID=A0A2A2JS35_9BILA|nr:hypothetical protein WR25_21118 [Diploscapter pachys]